MSLRHGLPATPTRHLTRGVSAISNDRKQFEKEGKECSARFQIMTKVITL